jgi:hypothetical protein
MSAAGGDRSAKRATPSAVPAAPRLPIHLTIEPSGSVMITRSLALGLHVSWDRHQSLPLLSGARSTLASVPVRIFLSHNTRDRAWCESLKASAEELGIDAYLAEHDVRPGTNLAGKVTGAIDRSDAVVVLISDNSVTAPYVNQEIGYALKARKPIIPLVQPGISDESLAMLRGLEYIPFDFARPHGGTMQLRTALTRLVQQQTAREQRHVAVLALACVMLIMLTVDS